MPTGPRNHVLVGNPDPQTGNDFRGHVSDIGQSQQTARSRGVTPRQCRLSLPLLQQLVKVSSVYGTTVTHSRRRSMYCRRRHLPSDTYPPPQKRRTRTKSSATADGPRDATCQSKSCQLLHDSVGTSCTTNPEQIEVMELDGYSRPTCNKLCASNPDALDRRRCNPQARPSTTFVDHTVDLSRRNFQSPDFRAKFQREVPLFLRYQDFLKT